MSKWADDTVKDTFVVGEWSVAPRGKFNVNHDSYPNYVVSHVCEKSLQKDPNPWVWRAELHKACPDCKTVCPEEVETVFEMMK